ncbi:MULTISPECIES: anti-sigma factor domain-containing protein [unclassified Rathayibacter]|uniref:anti-sigma factor n=1 Tax=unclassified Rathayibacter TaxID=2609250 RepID=UPI00188AC4AB|nr:MULTISPECIES: anti-sigma factor [unclassified Rathayibacter]MBF4461700.1 anti-sigma factor [Rathayibacter sp. VKM Ac-2879]
MTPDEQARYERFLAEHPEARAEADEFTEVVEALAAEAAPVSPSPGLKSELLALIANTPQVTQEPTRDEGPPRLRAVEPSTPEAALEASPTTAESRARTRWFARPAVYVSAAAVAAVLIVGGVTLPPLLSSGPGQTQQQTALEQIRNAPDVQETVGVMASGGSATLVWSSSLGRSALVVDDMAPPPEGKTYELWYIGSSGPVAAGTFDGGEGQTVAPLEGSLAQGAVVAVTVENAGGSPTPTSDPILAIATA